jgi:hypothetical protein
MVAYMYPPKWYLGQRRGIKGHEDLIDAITVCLNNGVDLRSVFIGGAWNNARWYENRVRAYASPKWKDRIIFWYRSKVLARYISVEKDTVSLYGGVIAKPSRAKEERPWWNKKYISHFAFVLQLER